MYSSLTRRSSSLLSLLARSNGDLASSMPFSAMPGKFALQVSSLDGSKSIDNISSRRIADQVWAVSVSSVLSSSIMNLKGNVSAPCALKFISSFHSSSQKEILNRGEIGSRSRSAINFVRGALEEDEKNMMDNSRYSIERSVDFVHIKLLRNNSFVTVTDSKGNKKFGFSNGSMDKGGAKHNRYSAEAVSEHVGRMCRNLGVRSVVIKVNGFTFFKKKKQAIMSWKEGYTNSRTDQNPVVCIEDTTRKPHNGCRLPKKRRT